MDMDMLDIHMPELTDTHMTELTPTELTHTPTELISSVRDPLMLKLSQKLGMVLMDTESRLVKLLKNPYTFLLPTIFYTKPLEFENV